MFIAGATKTGRYLKFQARKIQVNRLSASPFAIFPIVFADKGAINNKFDIFIISICKTGSDLYYHANHSSSSLNQHKSGF